MHEMSIALAVVGQVEDAARAAGRGAAEAVTLRVGELAGVVPDALRFCFELACDGTVAAGARLVTEQVPGRARCGTCPHEWATGMPPELTCPRCGGAAQGLLSGRELEIAAVRWAARPAAALHEEP
ncbi:hydrogenase maturation nickel metallochaperone HypA/HybF [Actinacidiphila guanduensis]|jgi:hydrogenase nickel incorporation protein HypA/HybF|uniref:Hydrogenase maturation factor HypA n=1 Tax=Actinacidiphila guanduensis TaxID=310781 RepID=A0A1H0HKE0_9ACTN|nr:hydrogenase maturation nickel metallochaperone HypA [Actinacidiphila guanduensis]SDO19514.1 Hydrogenase-3 nickel incorporation protein HypA [Actinacidiphila guanduensis]